MKGRDEEHAGRTKIRLPLRLDDLLRQMLIFTSTNLRQCLSVADIGSVFVEIPRGRRGAGETYRGMPSSSAAFLANFLEISTQSSIVTP